MSVLPDGRPDARPRSRQIPTPEAARRDRELERIWTSGHGWRRLSAVNHSVVGMRFILTSLVFFTIGGLLAMLIRAQLATTRSPFLDAESYAQVFTMHGTVMMFLFAIPFFEGYAIYFLPKMLGARDLAFPRMSAYGYWCYLFGGAILIAALIAGYAPKDGWFMYTPLSSATYSPGVNADIWLLGITFVEISALSAAVEIVVTILKMRAPGMTLDRMPIFAWYMLVVAAMMVLGFPPLIVGSLLLEAERAFGLPFFNPTRGGDPLLWQHLFWLFGHPEVYIIFLPAAGALSTLLPVFAGRPLAGRRMVIAAVLSMGFLSFGLWVHHMYTVGLPHLSLAFFSAASAVVAIPTAVQIFAWIGTLATGRPRLELPMLHVFGFFFVFVIGGLTGVMLAVVPFDWQAHDSHFVVAHLHYVLVGGFLFPMMAAAYYWLPALTGRMPDGRLARPAFWLIFIGFNLTFFIMHLTGLLGMPRRVDHYTADTGWEVFNLISSIGSFVMTGGFMLVVVDIALTLRYGRQTEPDPWGAGTLDWAVPKLPAPSYNFPALPRIAANADRLRPRDIGPALAEGEGYLPTPRNGWMETLVTGAADAEPEHIALLPRQTFLPLYTALATGTVFLALIFKLYWWPPLGIALVVALFLCWTARGEFRRDHGRLDAGLGARLPLHAEVSRPLTWWAMAATIAADATAYAALLFGGLFLWLSAPGWPPPDFPVPPVPWVLVALAAPVIAALAARLAERGGEMPLLALTLVCQLAALAALVGLILAVPAPTSHAALASMAAVLAYAALHVGLGALFAAYGIWRVRAGYVSTARRADLTIGRLWQDYSALVALIAVGFLYALTHLSQTVPL
ncbi:cytochrome c oxidase subunit I [Haematobacter genomosp. 1]|uniref:cytochrome-c oxidase n=1 Tax=Haematobacter genomosp. 1 TaxID=366618 RepID=A0A212AGU7_9RHOB|nr:cytochrome c oxidase subunit I [Haematobacter genomosp. 1]OWJ80694.1 cytochrome c oxidase subunit I [Haematobacter genomosp. 1]